MILYGYINEEGYLRTVEVAEKNITKQKEKGDFYNETVTVEQQIKDLEENGLKPVDIIDGEKLKSNDEFKSVRLEPFNNEDRISYKYVEYFNEKLVSEKIFNLKQQLDESDYKILKSYEASILKLDLPYNVQDLHDQRNNLREAIRMLEKLIR